MWREGMGCHPVTNSRDRALTLSGRDDSPCVRDAWRRLYYVDWFLIEPCYCRSDTPLVGIIWDSALWALCRYRHKAHSTGHPKRLCRFGFDAGRFERQEEYSKEELVAEITAAMLCHDCAVDSQSSIKNSAAYLQGWTRFITEKSDAFLSAVNQAYKARAFILKGEGA
jgi:hypothetical protein